MKRDMLICLLFHHHNYYVEHPVNADKIVNFLTSVQSKYCTHNWWVRYH